MDEIKRGDILFVVIPDSYDEELGEGGPSIFTSIEDASVACLEAEDVVLQVNVVRVFNMCKQLVEKS